MRIVRWQGEKGGRKVRWQDRRGGMVVRWQVAIGGRVVRWQVGIGGRVVRWQGGKGGRVLRWQGGRFLVLFEGGGRRVSPRFHLFVSDVNQRNQGAGCVQDIFAWPQG